MDRCRIGDPVVVHKDPFAYISHPSIAVLHDGEWLAAFNPSRRREPRLHPGGNYGESKCPAGAAGEEVAS